MRLNLNRLWTTVAALALSVSAFAGTLSVTAPTNNQFLGRNNTLSFLIRQAVVQVQVQAVITGPGGSSTVRTTVTPNVDGQANGTLALNFSESAPQGDYTIVVSATEPNNTYTPVTLNVKVDTVSPKLLQFSPQSGSFVKGQVRVGFRLLEQFMKEWRITVNNQDIPNNSGTTETDLNVTWDTTAIDKDGAQNISLVAKDQADNALNFGINVTIDRLAPNSTIAFPRGDTPIRPGSNITVLVDVRDQFNDSVDGTGVDVVLQRTDGTFIGRPARVSYTSQGQAAWRWAGRIRYRAGVLPRTFKIVVTTVDKAGNTATRQEQTVQMGG